MSTPTLDVIDRLRELPAIDLRHFSTPELRTAREELRTARDGAFEIADRIIRTAAGRGFTGPQQRDHDLALRRVEEAARILEIVEDNLAERTVDLSQIVQGAEPFSTVVGSRDAYADGRPLTRTQTVHGYVRARGLVRPGEEDLGLGRYVRGLVTGDWRGADAERRAMAEGTLTAGGHLVPTLLSAQIIDKARNDTAVLRAGARLVPMPNRVLDIARWEGDPVPAWRNEAASIAASDGTLGKITLTARSLAGLVVVSRELLEDAAEIDDQVRTAFAAQFALIVDKAALYGSGTAPEPRGVKNTSGITTVSMGTNGAQVANYDPLADAKGALRDLNERPSGYIMSTRTLRTLAKLKDTTNQPLVPPAYVADVPRFDTNQVPNNLTQGTSNNASDLFTADWSQLYVGVRTELQISVLTERYADTGQVGILCWWRGDVAVARPAAFAITVGITP